MNPNPTDFLDLPPSLAAMCLVPVSAPINRTRYTIDDYVEVKNDTTVYTNPSSGVSTLEYLLGLEEQAKKQKKIEAEEAKNRQAAAAERRIAFLKTKEEEKKKAEAALKQKCGPVENAAQRRERILAEYARRREVLRERLDAQYGDIPTPPDESTPAEEQPFDPLFDEEPSPTPPTPIPSPPPTPKRKREQDEKKDAPATITAPKRKHSPPAKKKAEQKVDSNLIPTPPPAKKMRTGLPGLEEIRAAVPSQGITMSELVRVLGVGSGERKAFGGLLMRICRIGGGKLFLL